MAFWKCKQKTSGPPVWTVAYTKSTSLSSLSLFLCACIFSSVWCRQSHGSYTFMSFNRPLSPIHTSTRQDFIFSPPFWDMLPRELPCLPCLYVLCSCFHLPSAPTGCRSASVARHGLKGRRHVAKINGLAFFSTGRPLRVSREQMSRDCPHPRGKRHAGSCLCLWMYFKC